jgi:putative ABC transport system permease protein
LLLVLGLAHWWRLARLDATIASLNDEENDLNLDIQKGELDGVRAMIADPANGAGPAQYLPVLRARVVGIDGRDTTSEGPDPADTPGAGRESGPGGGRDGEPGPGRDNGPVRLRGLTREFTVTYRDHLEANERIVGGTFWKGPSADAEVSIEQGVHERSGINLGDVMRFDILGRVITARVTSIRNVEWRDSRNGGFMFVFRPGVLEESPQTYVAPLKGPRDAAGRARFQHALVERFPNVSVIDLHEILETVRDVTDKVTLAITVVGGLVLFSGGLILVGAVAMTKYQRVYEAAVFKTLGATTRMITRMLLLEYGVLGLLAGLVGSLGAVGLTWASAATRSTFRGASSSANTRQALCDRGPCRGDRRAVQPRYSQEQTPCDAESRIAHDQRRDCRARRGKKPLRSLRAPR